MAERLSGDAVQSGLERLGGWSEEGGAIKKQFSFDDFRGAIAFVNTIADLAEAANHHPDITINYSRVSLTLTSHDAGGLTQKDLDLAQEIERAAANPHR